MANALRICLLLLFVSMGANTIAATAKLAKQLDQRAAVTIEALAQAD